MGKDAVPRWAGTGVSLTMEAHERSCPGFHIKPVKMKGHLREVCTICKQTVEVHREKKVKMKS